MFFREKVTSLCFCLLFALTFADEDCDKWQCRGPIRYYEELNCKPVYAKPGDCCPVKYDCSHLSNRAADKCYANGREYAIGDRLEDEDRASPCDINCRCDAGYYGVASFSCAAVDCYFGRAKKGCTLIRKPDDCCPSDVCPNETEEKVGVTCVVEGITYKEGEFFYPKGKPLECSCKEGFKGEFVEPFCKKHLCGTELRSASMIYNKCVPVYWNTLSPATSCSISFRCPNNKDKIIKAATVKSSTETSAADTTNKSDSDKQPSDLKCTFGNMTMDIGDELNQNPDSSLCEKCVCELPPTPTCRQFRSEECDMS